MTRFLGRMSVLLSLFTTLFAVLSVFAGPRDGVFLLSLSATLLAVNLLLATHRTRKAARS